MVYKTLHGYIFRELLRIFLLTASALTTLMAFGGMFRPLTKQGIELSQLMLILINLMPAMLAYAIPIAALFAAVLVYWRMSTDNEMTACRASGISFVAIVMPALLLGLTVASTDLIFVNYVVPVFLQRTERSIISDMGNLLVSQIGRQETFPFGNLVIYADSATEQPTGDPKTDRVILTGMAATRLKDGAPIQIVVARTATLTITNAPDEDGAAEISVALTDAAAFDPKNFRKISGSLSAMAPIPIPSQLKSKPKFLNLRQLFKLNENPTKFPPVMETIKKIQDAYVRGQASKAIYDQWIAAAGKPQDFSEPSESGADPDILRLSAPIAELSPDNILTYYGLPGSAPLRLEHYAHGRLEATYTCDAAEVQITQDDISGLSAAIQLKGLQKFQLGNVTLYADSSSVTDDLDTVTHHFHLQHVFAMRADDPSQYLIAPDARITIQHEPNASSDQVSIKLTDPAAFSSRSLQRIAGTVTLPPTLNDVKPFKIPAPAASKGPIFDPLLYYSITSVFRTDHIHKIGPNPTGPMLLSGIDIPSTGVVPAELAPLTLLENAKRSPSPSMHKLSIDAVEQIQKLFQSIASELHSRGSFSLSCLTLVLLGAGLGILLRGKNPLAVFVVGFVPAIVLVLLITAGRQIAEGNHKNIATGIILIWAGNVLLLAITGVVYSKLFRH